MIGVNFIISIILYIMTHFGEYYGNVNYSKACLHQPPKLNVSTSGDVIVIS